MVSGSEDRTVRVWSTATGEQIQCFETRKIPRRVRFTDDGRALDTDSGLFDLNPSSDPLRTSPLPPEVSVVLVSPWVKQEGLDVLWLPHEYRGRCSATHGTFLVIGQVYGAMSFFLLQHRIRK